MDIATLKAFSNTKLADNTNIHPSKHREVNDAIIDEVYVNRTVIETNATNIATITPLNLGFVAGVNVGVSSGSLSVGGNISSATASSSSDNTIITCNLANAMPNTSYIVKAYFESVSALITTDNNFAQVVFKPITVGQFEVSFEEIGSPVTQNIKIHFEIIATNY